MLRNHSCFHHDKGRFENITRYRTVLNISILELFLFYIGRLQKLLYILCYVEYTDSDSYVYKPVVSLKYDHNTCFARYKQVLVHHLSS